MEAIMDILREASRVLADAQRHPELTGPLLEELQSVIQMVAVEVLEIRGSRAVRSMLGTPREENLAAATTNTKPAALSA